MPRLLFCSYHLYGDPSSGAAISARELLEVLTQRGWDCRVFCGSMSDFEDGRAVETILADQQVAYSRLEHSDQSLPFSLLQYNFAGVSVIVFEPLEFKMPPEMVPGFGFIAMLDRMLERDRPDVVLTYGGFWLGRAIIVAAKQRGIPVVFWLHNCEYPDPRLFEPVDGVIVPSKYVREHYRRTLNLAAVDLPPFIIRSRVVCATTSPRYVTFVNPHPAKGAFYFAGIAEELGRRRPDIPLLAVLGRAGTEWLRRAGLAPANCPNLHVMANTPDPRDFYSVTKLMLMPSLWAEAFGRVAVEAMLNGIPVLASDRGALPEVLKDAGFVFAVGAEYTPTSRRMPGGDEIAPWVETIIRLWDEPSEYDAESRRARFAAEPLAPADLLDRYAQVIRDFIASAIPPGDEAEETVLRTLLEHIEQSAGPAAAAMLRHLTSGVADAMLDAVQCAAPVKLSRSPSYRAAPGIVRWSGD